MQPFKLIMILIRQFPCNYIKKQKTSAHDLMSPKFAQIIAIAKFTSKGIFCNKTKKLSNIWATLVAKFVAKNFQKSPNQVELILSRLVSPYS